METIFETQGISIYREDDETIVINHDEEYKYLIDSFQFSRELIIEETNRMIKLKSEMCQLLSEFMVYHKKKIPYDYSILMLEQLIKQAEYLESIHKGIMYFHYNNIVVINDNLFIFVNHTNISNIEYFDYNNKIQSADDIPLNNSYQKFIKVSNLHKENLFVSPEMRTIIKKQISDQTTGSSLTVKPRYLPIQSWYYSLSILMIYCLKNEKDLYMKTFDYYRTLIEDIEDTKMYYCLLRCLDVNYNKRYMLFV